MAIGSSINYSVPTVGTTVSSLAKVQEAMFTKSVAQGGVLPDVPIVLRLRPAIVSSQRRLFGLTWAYNPGINDQNVASQSGRITVTLNVDAVLGSTIAASSVLDQTKYALSVALASTLLDNLRDGSVQ